MDVNANKRGANLDIKLLKVRLHVKVKFAYLGLALCYEIGMFEYVWPPHDNAYENTFSTAFICGM